MLPTGQKVGIRRERHGSHFSAQQGQCAPVHLIPRQIYYFDHLPVNTDISFIFGIAMVTLILSGFAGYFPARQAAKLDPVQTIRND